MLLDNLILWGMSRMSPTQCLQTTYGRTNRKTRPFGSCYTGNRLSELSSPCPL